MMMAMSPVHLQQDHMQLLSQTSPQLTNQGAYQTQMLLQ
jgi:hypothetical protein